MGAKRAQAELTKGMPEAVLEMFTVIYQTLPYRRPMLRNTQLQQRIGALVAQVGQPKRAAAGAHVAGAVHVDAAVGRRQRVGADIELAPA